MLRKMTTPSSVTLKVLLMLPLEIVKEVRACCMESRSVVDRHTISVPTVEASGTFASICFLCSVIINIKNLASTTFIVFTFGHFTVFWNVNALIKLKKVPMLSGIQLRVDLASTRACKLPKTLFVIGVNQGYWNR